MKERAIVKTPDWDYWKNLASVRVREAVALSLNEDPLVTDQSIQTIREEFLSEEGNNAIDNMFLGYRNRLKFAVSHIEAGMLETVNINSSEEFSFGTSDKYVKLSVFRAWGESLPEPLTFPNGFPKAALVKAPDKQDDKPLGQRSRATLLRIIRALSVMANVPDRGATKSIELQLQQLGFTSPKEATIRALLEETRSLEPD
jgi:hypothetical protein